MNRLSSETDSIRQRVESKREDRKEDAMTDIAQEVGLWLARGLGAVAGALISLIYLLPQGRREAAGRFFIGVASGMIFGGAAGIALSDWLALGDRLSGVEITMMGSAAASLSAWWMLGALTRMAERWGR
jgi:hypothetical protein